ncbi:MAG: TSUP family transporter [Bacillota bacterium]|nr:TSUP family transporter [Bacillota bacterium]
MYLIVCPLVFLAGFVDAIAGGGGLISLPAYLLAGIPAHNAIATNKLSSCMGTTISALHYYKKRFMKWKLCLPGIILAIAGSYIGSNISLLLNESVLQAILLVVLPLIGLYVLKGNTLKDTSELLSWNRKLYFQCACIAFVVGIYDGLYGPGTGSFLMILLTGICHLDLNSAQGTTKAINLTTNVTALTVFLFSGKAMLTLGLIAGACNMLGNYLGSHLFIRKGSNFTKPIILIVLVLLLMKVLTGF